jgi:hypothetical protein
MQDCALYLEILKEVTNNLLEGINIVTFMSVNIVVIYLKRNLKNYFLNTMDLRNIHSSFSSSVLTPCDFNVCWNLSAREVTWLFPKANIKRKKKIV